MKQIGKTTKRALILFTLLTALAFTPSRARADEPAPGPGPAPVLCGGAYGYSYSEPFWVGDVWSIEVTAPCNDGSTEYGIGPVGPDGGYGGPGWTWWGDDE